MDSTSKVDFLQSRNTDSKVRGVFLTLILSTVEHLVLILLEFLEFLVEFFQNLLEFLFKIAWIFLKKVLIWLKYWRKITNICLLWAMLWLLLLFGAQKYNKTSLLIWNLFRCYLKKNIVCLKIPQSWGFWKNCPWVFGKRPKNWVFFLREFFQKC